MRIAIRMVVLTLVLVAGSFSQIAPFNGPGMPPDPPRSAAF